MPSRRGVREQVLDILGSDKRLSFLVALEYWISISARGSYDLSEHESLRGHNEVSLVVVAELRAEACGTGHDRSDSDFWQTIFEKAANAACEGGVQWAIIKAIEETRG